MKELTIEELEKEANECFAADFWHWYFLKLYIAQLRMLKRRKPCEASDLFDGIRELPCNYQPIFCHQEMCKKEHNG
jgi:hypothetical protein